MRYTWILHLIESLLFSVNNVSETYEQLVKPLLLSIIQKMLLRSATYFTAPVVDNRFLFQQFRRFVHFRLLFFSPMPQIFSYPVSVGTDFPFNSHSVPSHCLTGMLYKRRVFVSWRVTFQSFTLQPQVNLHLRFEYLFFASFNCLRRSFISLYL